MKNLIVIPILVCVTYILGVITPFILNDIPKNTSLEIYIVDVQGQNILFIDGLTVTNERDTTSIVFKNKEELSEYISVATAYTTNVVPNNGIKFIWNDDEESIPVDGTPILLEMTKGNNIYLSPINVK